MIAQNCLSGSPVSVHESSVSVHDDSDLGIDIPTVFVIDPDPSTGNSIRELVDGYQVKVQSYPSGRAFFADFDGTQPGCIVLELRIFDTSGMQIQRRLAEKNQHLPMVYVTSNIDVSTAVVLMREGAVHVLEKPLRSVELLNAVQEALARNQSQRRQNAINRSVQESICTLTCKERELVTLLAEAKSTKSIAAHLAISSRAVELRRRSVMDKLGLSCSLELMRFAVLAYQGCHWLLNSAQSDGLKSPQDSL
jgi:two-component system, LuxR family, response regulator FixJ